MRIVFEHKVDVRLCHECLDEVDDVSMLHFFERLDFGLQVCQHFVIFDAFLGDHFDRVEDARFHVLCLADPCKSLHSECSSADFFH